MDLEKIETRSKRPPKGFLILFICLMYVCLSSDMAPSAQYPGSRKPRIIRDTDVAEETMESEAPAVKEPSPELSRQSISIGNFYLKKKNYAAAIQRFLEAIEYQPDSGDAYDALARAYERNGEPSKAAEAYRRFMIDHPGSDKVAEFRERLQKLERGAD